MVSWITERDIDFAKVAEEAVKLEAAKPGRTVSGAGGGRLTPIMSCMSLNPRALEGERNMTSAVTFGASVLTRVQEEAIATTVASANHCRY